MIEKKFNKPAIILSAIALALDFLGFAFESIIVAIFAIVLTVRKKETNFVKLPVFLSIVAIIGSILFLILLIKTNLMGGESGYWFADLIGNILK